MYERELEAAIKAIKEAEEKILEIYHTDFAVEIKSDDSPVTIADKTADALLRKRLSEAFPDYGFLTEESIDTKDRLSMKAIWIIDPVDGTKEFVSKNGEFATNVALCVNHEIVVGLINCPVSGDLYYAIKGEGAYLLKRNGEKVRLHVSDRTKKLKALRSISFFFPDEKQFYIDHADRFDGELTPMGAALKFCAIARGDYDYFYRTSDGTKEWDIAPGVLIIEEAGGVVVEPDGGTFTFNREDVYNRKGYIIANKKENAFGM